MPAGGAAPTPPASARPACSFESDPSLSPAAIPVPPSEGNERDFSALDQPNPGCVGVAATMLGAAVTTLVAAQQRFDRCSGRQRIFLGKRTAQCEPELPARGCKRELLRFVRRHLDRDHL